MAEIWDAYTETGQKVGQKLIRGQAIPDGLYHLCVNVLVRDPENQVLLTQRSQTKTIKPSYWEISAGGSVLAGESSAQAAQREAREETGLELQQLKFIDQVVDKTDKTIYHNYLGLIDTVKAPVRLQAGETQAYLWLKQEELTAFFHEQPVLDKSKKLAEQVGFRL